MITQSAAELLLDRIEGDSSVPKEPRQVVIPTIFVPRESICKAPGS
jgi:DNA-binding LacI/PurR family transcriptional regulator